MATKPNYSFEKRQRELAKKQKREDKAAQKAAQKQVPGTDGEPHKDQPDAPEAA